MPLLIALISAASSVSMAIWLQQVYASSEAFQTFLLDTLRLSDVVGAEVLVLALAFVAGQLIQLVLMITASRMVFTIPFGDLWRLLVQSFLASLTAGLTAYITLIFVVDGVNQNTFIGISLQGLVAGLMGVLAATLIYTLLRAPEVFEVYRSFRMKILKTDVVAPQPENI